MHQPSYDELKIMWEEAEKKANFYKIIADYTYDWEVFRDETGKIVYLSNSFERITGYAADEVLTGHVTETDIIHPDDAAFVLSRIRMAMEQKEVSDLQFRIVCRNGEIRFINLCAQPVFIEGTFKGIRTSAREITHLQLFREQIRAQQALIESEHKFRVYFQNSPYAIFLLNSAGYITYINPVGCQMLGCEEYVVKNKHFSELIHEEHKVQIAQNYIQLITHGEIHDAQMHFSLPDASEIEISIDAKKVLDDEYIVFVKDITTAKNAQKLLEAQNAEIFAVNEEYRAAIEDLQSAKDISEENEAKFRAMYENTSIGIMLLGLDMRIVNANRAACEFVGLSEHELLTQHLSYLLTPEATAQTVQILNDLLENNIKIHHTEKKYIQKFGKKVVGHISVSLIRNRRENPLFFLINIQDITEKKHTEVELIEAKEKAEESNRLKTAFLHNMSHEIRTPMNAIMGFSALLNRASLSDDKRLHYSTIIQNSCNQLLSIVTDILTISSIDTHQETIKNEDINLNEVMDGLYAIFRQQINPNKVKFAQKNGLNNFQSNLILDKTKLVQILTNLLSNAIKFTSDGRIEFGYSVEQNTLIFFVEDSGIGIQKEHFALIFERFRQADYSISQKYGGTGLGLSISKGFVELMGGKIDVDSEPGKGTKFWFTVPYVSSAKNLPPQIKSQKSGARKTILVAEDEEYNFQFLSEALYAEGFSVLRASNGKEAIELGTQIAEIGLILMDIKMPVYNGLYAAIEIRKVRPQMIIIAQTAYAAEQETQHLASFFDDYVTKPINISLLIEKINKFIG